MKRLAWLALILTASTSLRAQTVVIHVHIHLDGRRVDAKGDSISGLNDVLNSAVMMTLSDAKALKAKLGPIKARVEAVKPRTAAERRAREAIKARIRKYEAYDEDAGEDDGDLSGVAAG